MRIVAGTLLWKTEFESTNDKVSAHSVEKSLRNRKRRIVLQYEPPREETSFKTRFFCLTRCLVDLLDSRGCFAAKKIEFLFYLDFHFWSSVRDRFDIDSRLEKARTCVGDPIFVANQKSPRKSTQSFEKSPKSLYLLNWINAQF